MFKNNELSFIEIENDLDTFYELLEVDCIDIVSRPIGNNGKRFDIICDDEGLFKKDNVPSYIMFDDNRATEVILGNIIIANDDNDGCLSSITDDEYDYIIQNIHTVVEKGKENNVIIGFGTEKLSF